MLSLCTLWYFEDALSPLQSGFRSTHLTSGRNPKNLRKKSETFPSLIFHGCIVTSAKCLQNCQSWFQVHPPHSKTFDLHFTEWKYFCRHGYLWRLFLCRRTNFLHCFQPVGSGDFWSAQHPPQSKPFHLQFTEFPLNGSIFPGMDVSVDMFFAVELYSRILFSHLCPSHWEGGIRSSQHPPH